MDFLHFKAGPDDDGRRLDRILKTLLPASSLSGLYKSLRSGLIKVDGKKQKPDFHVSQGSDITVASFLLNPDSNSPQSGQVISSKINSQKNIKPLPSSMIVLRTKDLLFLNKPYDIPVQKSAKNDKALDELVKSDWEFNNPVKESLSFKTGPLHRLDKKTTGLLCFSQSLEGARWFSQAIQDHSAVKTYVALVQGKMTEKQHWEDRILRQDDENRQNSGKLTENSSNFHTVSVDSEGKPALTDAIPLQTGKLNGKDVTFVKFIIYTGRTHQIRASSAAHGFPLYGDTAYGGNKSSFEQELYLHAVKLQLPENDLQIPHLLYCPISDNYKKILRAALINPDCEL